MELTSPDWPLIATSILKNAPISRTAHFIQIMKIFGDTYVFHRPWAPPEKSAAQDNDLASGVATKTHFFFKRKTPLSQSLQKKYAYQRKLDSWVMQAPPASSGNTDPAKAQRARKRAMEAINRWTASDKTQPLVLGGLGLTTCPPLPEGVQQVVLSGNEMTSLPKMSDMPETLRFLDLRGNRITYVDSENAASSHLNLQVNLGTISMSREQSELLDQAAPGPHYFYNVGSSAADNTSAPPPYSPRSGTSIDTRVAMSSAPPPYNSRSGASTDARTAMPSASTASLRSISVTEAVPPPPYDYNSGASVATPTTGPAAQDLESDLTHWVDAVGGGERDDRIFAREEILRWHARYLQTVAWRTADGSADIEDFDPPPLRLFRLGLTTCPPLPDGVKSVDLSGNELAFLPNMKAMPKSLRKLDLKDNSIRYIGDDDVESDAADLVVDLGVVSFPYEAAAKLDNAYPGPSYSYKYRHTASDMMCLSTPQ